MSWNTIKKSIQADLLSRELKNPNIRLNALERVEKLLKSKNLNLIKSPELEFRSIEKNALKRELSNYKESGKLSAAESSVINEIYRRI